MNKQTKQLPALQTAEDAEAWEGEKDGVRGDHTTWCTSAQKQSP